MIVGAGTFGASLAWWLAGRGDDVVLVDQFEPGDARATSGGETRLIRCSHGADADYAAMARRARTLWRRARGRVGRGPAARVRRVLVRALATTAGRPSPSACWASWTSRPSAGRSSRRRGASRRSRATTWRGCCTSPRPACCARSGPCRRWRARPQARGARLVRGRARPDGAAVAVGDGGAGGRPRRLELRRLAGAALPRPRQAAGHAPGAVLLRRRRRRGATRPAGSTTTARPTAPATSTRSA